MSAKTERQEKATRQATSQADKPEQQNKNPSPYATAPDYDQDYDQYYD